MAWKTPLADQMIKARTKWSKNTTNRTFMIPLPTSPRPTSGRAP